MPSHLTIQAELVFGESQEVDVIHRWAACSPVSSRAVQVVKTPPMAPFDFLALDKKGFPVAYLEVKVRRTPFAKYGDAMCPLSKHRAALAIHAEYGIPAFLVTEYACGVIAEVALITLPKSVKDVRRRDRPGTPAIAHAFYTKAQLSILETENP